MAKEAGTVKIVQGKVQALNALTGEARELHAGEARELHAGDILYQGEKVVTEGADAKVTISQPDGKKLTLSGNDTLTLDGSTTTSQKFGDEASVSDVSALQKALLNGSDLSNLEETAAGGDTAAGGNSDGTSLSAASFDEGGHYSNINETYRNLTDSNRAFASYDSPIGGYSDGNANAGDLTPPKPSVSVEFTEDKNNDGFLTYTENKNDGKQNESPVLIKVSNVIAGDIIHVTLTKPDGSTEDRTVAIDQNIINNGYKIDDMPVAGGKTSKVEAYITDSSNPNTIKSNEASDSVTPYEIPTIRFTEDKDNNGFLSDAENKGTDENFRTSPVEITLPKDLVVGDKIVITYTDPLHPSQNLEKSITLTQEMINNHKVTGYELPIFPGVKSEASVHVIGKDGSQKTGESAPDSVTPQNVYMSMDLPEQQTLHEISRQESVSSYKKTYNGVEIDLGDERVNHTTAKITLPNRIDDGDKLTLHVTKPDGSTYNRNFNIHMNDRGVITSVDEVDSAGHVITNYNTSNKNFFKEDTNQWAIKVDGFELENGKDTKIEAEVTHLTHPDNPNLPTERDSESASLEYVKTPEVIFEEANGAKTMSREQAISDNDLNSTTVTIKLPKNAVDGDKVTVTIKEPDGTTNLKHYTVEKDATGKLVSIKNDDDASDHVAIKEDGRSFEISNIKTATGVKTEVTAEIVDSDGNIQHAQGSSSVTIAGINDMAVRFVEDEDGNVSLTRDESMKDGNLKETTIAVKVPNNVIAGDIVTINIDNGDSPKTYKVTGRDQSGKITLEDSSTHASITASDKNEIEIKGVHITAGKPINVTAETTDASGGKKAEAQNHNILEKLHDDMKITFEEDANKDGLLSSTEANSDHSETTTTATIKLPSNFVDGDKLIINSKTGNNNSPEEIYTIHKDSNGVVTVTNDNGGASLTVNGDAVKYPLANLQNGEETIITAKVNGAAGDVSETKSNIILDTGAGAGTGFRLFIDEDKDRNEVLSRDEAMSDHALNKTSATLQIPTTVSSGDVITITATGKNPETYTVVSNDGTSVVIRDADGDIVPLTSDNKLTISDVHIDKDHPAKVEATINGVTKTAEAKLETFDAANLKVEFKEDDASRDGKIDRDESVSVDGVKETTISVQVPYNVITGDKVQVLITEPKPDGTTATRPVNYTVSKAPNGDISLIDDNGVNKTLENNTIRIGGVAMLPGKETSATATITNAAGDMSATSTEAKAQLAPLSEAGLSVSIAADKNDDGVISRDESGSNTSKVNVSIPGSVIVGDKIDVAITNPDSTNVTKNYEVVGKDANGNITLKDLDDNSQLTLSRGQMLELDAKIEVGVETKAKVTLTDAFDKSVSVEDSAQHAEIDAMRGIMLNKDVTTLESGEKATTAKFFLNEDARAGDTVEIKYTDPNDHSQTKTGTYTLTDQDISKGSFEHSLDIDARSRAGYDLQVEATLKTSGDLHSKAYEADQSFYINANSYTIKYDENSTMRGGDSNNDTLVVEGGKVDFSNVANLDSKVESFENIQLKGGSEIKFNAQDVFDITDNLNTVLKINGDATNKVEIKGEWKEDSSVHADAGYKGYTSVDQIDGQTLHIQIEDKVQTDL